MKKFIGSLDSVPQGDINTNIPVFKKVIGSLENASQGDIGPETSTLNTMNAIPHDDEVSNPRDYALNKLMMTEAQFERYSHGFELLDLSHSGRISKLEFERVVGYFALANELSHEELNNLYKKIDDTNKGYFTITEFLRGFNNTSSFKLLAHLVKAVQTKQAEINDYSIDMKLEKDNGEGVENTPRDKFSFEEIVNSPANKGGQAESKSESIELKESETSQAEKAVEPVMHQSEPQLTEEPVVEQKDRRQIAIDYAKQVLKMEDSYIDSLLKVYDGLDYSNEGSISKVGFDEILMKFGVAKEVSMDEFDTLFNEMDRDSNGMISLIDFLENIHDSNLSFKANYIIDTILNKHDKKLGALRKQDITKRCPAGYLGVRDTEDKEIEKKLKQQVEDFNSWIDFEQGVKSKTKVDLKKCFSLLTSAPSKKSSKLSEAEKASYLSLIIDTIGKELKQQGSYIKRITELEKALQEERSYNQRQNSDIPQVKRLDKETEPMSHSLNDELEENIKKVDQDVTVFNNQMMENIKMMEDRFRVDTDALKQIINEKDESLRSKDSMLQELIKTNEALLSEKRDLELRLREYDQKVLAISESQETFLNDRDQQVLENQRLQSLIKNLTEENQGKINDLENARQRLITKNDSTQQTEAVQDEEKIDLIRQIKNLEKERGLLTKDLDGIKQILERASTDDLERQKQIEELNLQIQQSISADKHHIIMKERDFHLQESQGLKSQIEAVNREHIALRGEREELQNKVKDLELEKSQLREACNAVNSDLKVIIKDVEVFERREKDYLSQIEALTLKAGNRAILDEKMTSLNYENTVLKSQIKNLEQNLESKQKELAMLHHKEKEYNQRQTNENSHKRAEKHARAKHQEEQAKLVDELNRVENSLQSLKEKEVKYNKQIEVLSEEIELYSIDAEKLKIDNSLLENKIIQLNEKLSHFKKEKQHANELNQRLHEELNTLRKQVLELTEERDQYYHQVKVLHSQSQHTLKEDYEKLKLDYQGMKIRNLVLEDKIEILEKEKMRHEVRSRIMSHDDMKAMREEQRDHLNRGKENAMPRDTLSRPQIVVTNYDEQQPKVTPTKPNRGAMYKESPSQRNYLESIENLKNELRHVRESREAILNSLEKERDAIRHVIEDSPSAVPQYHCSNSRTPNKSGQLSAPRPKLIPRSAGKYEAGPVTRKEFSDLVYRPAPISSKKAFVRSVHDAKIRPRLGSKDNQEVNQEKGDIHKPVEKELFDDDIIMRDTSKFAFQILYWLTDNALITKELCSLYPINKSNEANHEIKLILQEIQTYSERAKSYYERHSIIKSSSNNQKAVYEFVLPLFSKCYKSHGQLQDIQNKIVSYLRGSQNQGPH